VSKEQPIVDSVEQGTDRDPMPVAPQQPDLDLCCRNGCDPCSFDLHDLAMDAYRQSLRAWRARHPNAPIGADGSS